MAYSASLHVASTHPGAGAWLNEGQTLESQGDPASLQQAVKAYDHALALLRGEDPRFWKARAVVWMNRGNALQRVGGAAAVSDAIRSYDQAIAHFEKLLGELPEAGGGGRYATLASRLSAPSELDAGSLNALGAAWMNRGVALQQARDADSVRAAIDSHENALAALSCLPIDADLAFRRNLAATWLNLADALLDSPSRDGQPRAAEAARGALQLVAPLVASQPAFVDLDLKARRALVMALGQQLHHFALPPEVTSAMASEVSDAIDDGMALARQWTPAVGDVFLALEFRLYCLGCQFYRLYQPQFLGEFVRENVTGSDGTLRQDFVLVAQESLDSAQTEIGRSPVRPANEADALKQVETLRELRGTLRWLEEQLSPGAASSSS